MQNACGNLNLSLIASAFFWLVKYTRPSPLPSSFGNPQLGHLINPTTFIMSVTYGSISRTASKQTLSAFSGSPHPKTPSTRSQTSSGFVYPASSARPYFKSRRFNKEEIPLPERKKVPNEKYLWIFPVSGLVLGVCLTSLIIYLKLSGLSVHKFCPVLDEVFSGGSLDPKIWTKEVECGGFG